MANLLQEQFCSAFSNQNSPKKDPNFKQSSAVLDDLDFTVKDISEAIDEIIATSAAGDDEIPAMFLKNWADALSYPLFLLWKASFNSSKIHQSFLSQLVTPVFKGGSKFSQQITGLFLLHLTWFRFLNVSFRRKLYTSLRKTICFLAINMDSVKVIAVYRNS